MSETEQQTIWGERLRGCLLVAAMLAVTVFMTAAGPSRAQTPPESACNEEKQLPAQIRCFLDAAESVGQPGICERAENPAVRFNCLGLYAEHSLDTAPCGRIVGAEGETQALRDACVSGVAIARREPAVCEEAVLPVVRDSCYLMLVLQYDADPANCGQIAEPTLKAACGDAR